MGSKVARPSLRLRAVIALALLLGFYFVTIGVALLLLALAVGISVVLWVSSHNFGYGEILALAICIVPALLLLYGVFTARAPPFKAPGREIAPNDAPKLFDMLQELANSARTRAPSKVFLSAMPNVGVTQVGGFMGIGSTRVLILGAPMLHMLRVSQVRAVLAHEYGHFVGSDTQLAGIHAYTHALFVSVLRSTTVRPSLRTCTSRSTSELASPRKSAPALRGCMHACTSASHTRSAAGKSWQLTFSLRSLPEHRR